MKIRKEYYQQPTLDVAKDLLGKRLVFNSDNHVKRGIIVETEAYIGPDDKASHASRGKTNRTAPMFEAGGISYVYLIYGMHYCLNIVTEAAGYPAAVLIRAVKVEDESDPRVASGPGKLCRYFGITKEHNQLDLTGDILYIEEGNRQRSPIVERPRIGVDYAGEWALKPWRFYLADSPAVSRK